MRRYRRWFVPLVVLAALASGQRAFAGPPTDQLRAAVDRVVEVLEDPTLKEESRAADRLRAVRKVSENIFDIGETAKRALGRHWHGRTDAERREFVELFGDLLERAYLGRIELYGGERVLYVGEAIDGDFGVVKTRVALPKTGDEAPVDYRMLRRGDRWLVYDVVIEGISLVANYRSQFNRIVEGTSYQELVRRMKAKHGEPPPAPQERARRHG